MSTMTNDYRFKNDSTPWIMSMPDFSSKRVQRSEVKCAHNLQNICSLIRFRVWQMELPRKVSTWLNVGMQVPESESSCRF